MAVQNSWLDVGRDRACMSSPGDEDLQGWVSGDDDSWPVGLFWCQINHVAVYRKNWVWAGHCCFDAGWR